MMHSDDEPDAPAKQEVICGLSKKDPKTTDIMSQCLPLIKITVCLGFILYYTSNTNLHIALSL